jgi:2-polyprenyl-3-methyl-5-hydroxy-6-metoxy-1,4-benzoquinol methylase
MANARNQTIDKTFLSIDQAEERGFIHRDYIAHCLRWTHVVKRLYERKTYQTARILDVGCGRELPMAKLLHSSRLIPQMYFGVDVGPIENEAMAKFENSKFPMRVWDNCNLLELELSDLDQQPANLVTSFEVLEHVEPAMMMQMLEHLKKLTTDDARFFISTPCWNRTDCAANHVNEMLYESLGAAFERHGFIVESVHGTFASIRDYQHLLTVEQKSLFDSLREYYDSNFLSCVFAPLFPAQSRNALWELRKHPMPGKHMKFKPITEVPKPWSSSAKWEDMAL